MPAPRSATAGQRASDSADSAGRDRAVGAGPARAASRGPRTSSGTGSARATGSRPRPPRSAGRPRCRSRAGRPAAARCRPTRIPTAIAPYHQADRARGGRCGPRPPARIGTGGSSTGQGRCRRIARHEGRDHEGGGDGRASAGEVEPQRDRQLERAADRVRRDRQRRRHSATMSMPPRPRSASYGSWTVKMPRLTPWVSSSVWSSIGNWPLRTAVKASSVTSPASTVVAGTSLVVAVDVEHAVDFGA